MLGRRNKPTEPTRRPPSTRNSTSPWPRSPNESRRRRRRAAISAYMEEKKPRISKHAHSSAAQVRQRGSADGSISPHPPPKAERKIGGIAMALPRLNLKTLGIGLG